MKTVVRLACLAVTLGSAVILPAAPPQEGVPGVPASVVVTLEPKRGKEVPNIEQADITVRQGKDNRPVSGFTPLARAETQLLLLIDDSARGTFDTEIPTLKRFLTALPTNFTVGVGYMRNGMTQMTAEFTKDPAEAAEGVRVALGPAGADVSPYDSLTDAVKKWPEPFAQRREVIMVSSGVEGLGGGYYSDNPYVKAGIESAVKAGIVVYAIYSPSVGHAGHSLWQTTWGQNFLSQLADETGGEMYWSGLGSPVSFQPFLDQFMEAQSRQYFLTFEARPESKSGLQPIKVSIPNKDASLSAPDKIFVKASL